MRKTKNGWGAVGFTAGQMAAMLKAEMEAAEKRANDTLLPQTVFLIEDTAYPLQTRVYPDYRIHPSQPGTPIVTMLPAKWWN